jgi:hypothetical protein
LEYLFLALTYMDNERLRRLFSTFGLGTAELERAVLRYKLSK